MNMTKQTISVQLSTAKKQKPEADRLEFGRTFTDHMFIMDYTAENGWHDPRIVPYQPIEMDPAAMVYHYGQSVFEGLKAYLSSEGRVLLFRPEKTSRGSINPTTASAFRGLILTPFWKG